MGKEINCKLAWWISLGCWKGSKTGLWSGSVQNKNVQNEGNFFSPFFSYLSRPVMVLFICCLVLCSLRYEDTHWMSADPHRHGGHIHPVLTFPVSTALPEAGGNSNSAGAGSISPKTCHREAGPCVSKSLKNAPLSHQDLLIKQRFKDNIKNF